MKIKPSILFFIVFLVIFTLIPLESGAGAPQTWISVNTTADTIDPNDGKCSLREAIISANEDTPVGVGTGECATGSGADTINLPDGVYHLTKTGAGNDNPVSGDLDIKGTLTIYGNGMYDTVIDNDVLDRVFHVNAGSNATLKLQELTVKDGYSGPGWGGGAGVLLEENTALELHYTVFKNHTVNGTGTYDIGGGIKAVLAQLTITNSFFKNNSAIRGGAIYISGGSTGNTIKKSLFLDNDTGGLGGAIANYGEVLIENSTFTGSDASSVGGAIFNYEDMEIYFSTFTRNSAQSGGAIAAPPTATSLIKVIASILAHNESDLAGHENCTPTDVYINSNFNMEDRSTCAFPTGPTTHFNTDPMLGPLSDYGGWTMTFSLLKGSPAINDVDPPLCLAEDQRGVSRPQGTQCDNGAFESDGNYSVLFLPLVMK